MDEVFIKPIKQYDDHCKTCRWENLLAWIEPCGSCFEYSNYETKTPDQVHKKGRARGMILPLHIVIYDKRARDGTWCAKQSKRYPHGCPNFPECPTKHPDFITLQGYKWYAVTEEFDIEGWEKSQAEKHEGENWSRRQLRNPRHWQKVVMKRLRSKAQANSNRLLGDIILEIPEACGVDVVRTMSKVGVKFEWGEQAKKIKKIMLIGKVQKKEDAKNA